MALTQVQPAMLGTPQPNNFKNRIINGAMVIDQRNAGASVTPTNGQYTLDRWIAGLTQASKFTVQQAAVGASGQTKALQVTSSSAYSVNSTDYFLLYQPIEGFNFADMQWGTANAKTVTLSFQVYCSLTGTFSGSILNYSGNRTYLFSYSIPVANTWTTISVTIPGDTTGTWEGATNLVGAYVFFNLGSGSSVNSTAGSWSGNLYRGVTGQTNLVATNGATFYITGVQLEVGVSATGFDYRPYGTELALCQRYYCKSFDIGTAPADGVGAGMYSTIAAYTNSNSWTSWVSFPVTMRTSPTITGYRATGLGVTNGLWGYYSGGWASFSSQAFGINTTGFYCGGNTVGGFTTGAAYLVGGHYTASAEL